MQVSPHIGVSTRWGRDRLSDQAAAGPLHLLAPIATLLTVSLSLARVDSAESASDSGSSGSFPPS